MKRMANFTLLFTVTLLTGLACGISAPAPELPPITVPYPTTLAPPPGYFDETATPFPSSVPVTDTSASSVPVAPEYSFSWLRLQIPVAVAGGGLSNVIPGVNPSQDVAPWDVYPLHEEIPLTGYALSGSFHEARIYIFPVQEFIALEPIVGERATELQSLLQNKPADPVRVPFLPFWNAGQVFLAMPAYLEFQNGSGIRYLTQYGQSTLPINNHGLFYSFQGLTTDGKFWVSAVLPVHHPSIQPTYDNPLPVDIEQFTTDYEAYTAMIRAGLEGQPLESFSPSVVELDAMIQSMFIGPQGP